MPKKSKSDSNSARHRILDYFLSRGVGTVINKEEIIKVAGIAEWARRVRELRDEYGWKISSFNDRSDLKPGQYVLESDVQGDANLRYVSETQRRRIMERDNSRCVLCGQGKGEIHKITGKKVRLVIDHLVPVSEGGSNEDDNLRTLCSVCNHLRKNLAFDSKVNVLALVRQQPRDIQKQIYEFLKKKFEGNVESESK
jgi:hypothetical protein